MNTAYLVKSDEPKLAPIRVDFVSGGAAHRRKFGGGKGQAIAKAGLENKAQFPMFLMLPQG